MPAQSETTPITAEMAFTQMLEKVRYEGAYPTRERAETVVRAVLTGLGRQLTGDERVELASRLPVEAARTFASQIPDNEPLTGWGFVKDLAPGWVVRPPRLAGTPVPCSRSSRSSWEMTWWTGFSPSSPPATPSCSVASS